MKIVVLDGYTANPGDIGWDELGALGDLHVYDRSYVEDVVSRSHDAEIVLINKVKLPRDVIETLPKLRYIGVTATGYNNVDLAAANERSITVTNIPAYSTPSTAQATMALLLELTNKVGYYNEAVQSGRWVISRDFCLQDRPLIELSGLTMGLIGFGAIGRAVATIARSFGMNICVHTRTVPNKVGFEHITFDSIDQVFKHADVLSLHCPLTDETFELVNAERLALMKPTAFLLNTGRGQLVHEAALAHALNTGMLAGAGLDVLSLEPPSADNPLLQAQNCIITPHISWATRASRRRLIDAATANVRAFIEGNSINVVK